MRYIAGVVLACLALLASEARADFVQIDPFTDTQLQGAGAVILTAGPAAGATRTLTGTTGLLGDVSRIQNDVLSATFFESGGSFQVNYDFTTMDDGFLNIAEAVFTSEDGISLESFLSNHSSQGQSVAIRWRVNGNTIDVTQDYGPGDFLVLQNQTMPTQLTMLDLTFTFSTTGGVSALSTFTSGDLLAVPEPGCVGIALAAFGVVGATRLRRRLPKRG